MLDVSLVLGGVVVLLAYLHWRQMRGQSRTAMWVPGWLPLIGHAVEFRRHFNNFLDYVRSAFTPGNDSSHLHKQTLHLAKLSGEKPYQSHMPGRPIFISVQDPVSIKHILYDNFEGYIKVGLTDCMDITCIFLCLGPGIPVIDGRPSRRGYIHHQRRAVAQTAQNSGTPLQTRRTRGVHDQVSQLAVYIAYVCTNISIMICML